MDDRIRQILDHGQTVDITTIGRRTGLPRRIEIVFHNIDGHIYISGMPRHRTRAWLLNLQADPSLTIHLKRGVTADLAATARVITDDAERRHLIAYIARAWRRTDIEEMVAWSPLIEVVIPGYGVDVAA